jgi:long-chain acyl-CoA synthetase
MVENLGDIFGADTDFSQLALIDKRLPTKPWEITYGELEFRINTCSNALVQAGLMRGDRVAISSGNRAEFLIAVFAVMRAGLSAVPVNFKLGAETIAYIYKDANIRLTFADEARRPLLPAGARVVTFDDDAPGEFAAFCNTPNVFLPVDMSTEDEAAVLYTSGSTGFPKGVPILHRGQLWIRRSQLLLKPTGGERVVTVVAAPFFHMNGLGSAVAMLSNGGLTVLLPDFNTADYVNAIQANNVNLIVAIPTMLAMVVRDRESLIRSPISRVKTIRLGSAPLTGGLVEDVRSIFPDADIGNGYGTTEAGQMIFGPHPKGLAVPYLSVGYPINGVECRLLSNDGREGAEGVLWVRSPAVMPGYLNLPEKTEEVLSPDGWYCTKDLFTRDENGFYFFVGRVDDMFVCGGENIYPTEVESLIEKHPTVAQAAVVPISDKLKGAKPVAFVVLRNGTSATSEEIKSFALANGPAYQHPRHVLICDSLPWAGTNKVDRKQLTKRAAELWG